MKLDSCTGEAGYQPDKGLLLVPFVLGSYLGLIQGAIDQQVAIAQSPELVNLSQGLPSQALLAQQIGTLPPPPTINFDQALPPASSTAAPPTDTVTIPTQPTLLKERVFQAPVSSPFPPGQPLLPGYRVYVNGSSELLLEQVRKIEPKAFITERQGRKLIQVGSFGSELNAQRQAQLLAQQGIGAQVSPVAAEVNAKSSHYFVVVPASQNQLLDLKNRAIQMGIAPTSVRPKESSLGSHLQVGPFAERKTAERWSRLLRDAGMDARVHFDR